MKRKYEFSKLKTFVTRIIFSKKGLSSNSNDTEMSPTSVQKIHKNILFSTIVNKIVPASRLSIDTSFTLWLGRDGKNLTCKEWRVHCVTLCRLQKTLGLKHLSVPDEVTESLNGRSHAWSSSYECCTVCTFFLMRDQMMFWMTLGHLRETSGVEQDQDENTMENIWTFSQLTL